MPAQTEIIIDIDNEGQAKIEVSGFAGPGCGDLTKNIERALGVVTDTEKKPEWTQKQVQNARTNR